MNYYHIWVNLKDTSKDIEFCHNVAAYLGHLEVNGKIEGFTLSRRKLGFGPPSLGEFHIVIEASDLVQLEAAFNAVAPRRGEIEEMHHRVYSAVTDFTSALYRDFPDPVRTG